jgi:hypothetical protein
VIESSTFWNNAEWEAPAIHSGEIALPTGAPNLPNAIFIQNTVMAGGHLPDSTLTPTYDVFGEVNSGGNNLIGIDRVGETNLLAAVTAPNATTMTVPSGVSFPTASDFKIRVAHVDTTTWKLVAEEMWVTLIADDGTTATLTVVRGQDGTVKRTHPINAKVTFSQSGFWKKGDKHGSEHDELWFGTTVAEVGGIQPGDTQFDVASVSDFPDVPFIIAVSDGAVSEQMVVTEVVNTRVTVTRRMSPQAFPFGANIAFSRIMFELEPHLGSLADNGGPTLTHAPLPDSPVLEAGSIIGFTGTTTQTATHLNDVYSFETVVVGINGSTLTLNDVSMLPDANSTPFVIRIDSELMEVTAVGVNGIPNDVSVVRNAYGSTPETLSPGTPRPNLATDVNSTTITTLQFATGSTFPAAPFALKINNELMKVTAVDVGVSNVTLTVVRGGYGTVATTHTTLDSVTSSPLVTSRYHGRGLTVMATALNTTTISVHDANGLPDASPMAPFLISLNGQTAEVIAVDSQTGTLTVRHALSVTQNDTGIMLDRGTFLLVDDSTTTGQSIIPDVPVRGLLGSEVVRITTAHHLAADGTNLITVERAVDRSPLSAHGTDVSLIVGEYNSTHGYHGQDLVLGANVGGGSTDLTLTVVGHPDALPDTPFIIMIDNEQMVVEQVQDIEPPYGTFVLTLAARAVHQTTATPTPEPHYADSTVLVLTDQTEAPRFFDCNFDGTADMDIGSVELAPTFLGTAFDDSIVVTALSSPGKHSIAITTNTVTTSYTFEANFITPLRIDGLAGDDTITINGTSQDETATLHPGAVHMVGATYEVQVVNVETVTINAGAGSDQAYLTGSAESNRLYSYADYSTLSDSLDAFTHRVEGFDTVTVEAAAEGRDYAFFYDSPDNDELDADPDRVILDRAVGTANATVTTAIGFQRIYTYATLGGADEATLTGSDATTNRLYGYADYSILTESRRSFYFYARGFQTVEANSPGEESSYAYLYDSSDIDQFTAGPTSATMDRADPWPDATANGFSRIYAYSTNGGDDAATLTGSSAGGNQFRGYPTYSTLTDTARSFYHYVRGFRWLTATGSETDTSGDRAYLYDSDGDDTFSGEFLENGLYQGGSLSDTAGSYSNWVKYFDVVYASSSDTGTTDLIDVDEEDLAYNLIITGTW